MFNVFLDLIQPLLCPQMIMSPLWAVMNLEKGGKFISVKLSVEVRFGLNVFGDEAKNLKI